jgi:polyisoprenoid-binding protein YceI
MDFDAMMVMREADLCTSSMKMILYADSVRAEAANLTQVLLGPSCLNVSQHRVVSFQSTAWEKVAENEYLLYGKLSMCGGRKLVVFEVIDHGPSTGSCGKLKLSKLEFDCVIKRSDFNPTRSAISSDFEDEISLKGILLFKSEIASTRPQIQGDFTIL